MPAGYQITQLYRPTCTDGQMSFFLDDYDQHHHVHITQAHLETDTGKTIHDGQNSLLDYNRAGGPLVEIVTGPDFHSTDEVIGFLKELQRLVRYNNISDADMEKWQMRADVNISLSDTDELGTRVEIKNMASFSAIRKAIAYEYERQSAALQAWESLQQETRGWDDTATFVMRSKDDALDYRYFPDPDFGTLTLDKKITDELSAFVWVSTYDMICQWKEYGLHKEYINGLLQNKETSDVFSRFVSSGHEPAIVVKRLVWPVMAYLKENLITWSQLPVTETQLADFFTLVAAGKIRENQLKVVMDEMLSTGKDAQDIVADKWFDSPGLSTDDLRAIIAMVINDNPTVVQQYKDGKTSVIGFFVGQVMKQTQGKADPKTLPQEIQAMLSA